MIIRWFLFVIGILCFASGVGATSSSTFWTPMTMDIQSYSVFHVGVDNYFTVFRSASKGGGSFPTDFGLTVGVLPFEKVQMEIGFDLLESSDHPLFFNAKIGMPQEALFHGSPALELGLVNLGTESGVTNQNIVYGVIGKTIPRVGRVSVGPYVGNADVLLDGDGNKENSGFMIAFDRGFKTMKDRSGNEYSKIVIATDYASGDNAIGAAGAGFYYYFTKDISLLAGPVWFNDEKVNGEWKWSIQLDINLPKLKK